MLCCGQSILAVASTDKHIGLNSTSFVLDLSVTHALSEGLHADRTTVNPSTPFLSRVAKERTVLAQPYGRTYGQKQQGQNSDA